MKFEKSLESVGRISKSNLHKQSAFTLAEVLITLGIIGVVAAITLPTLIKNYQKQVLVNQLKKTYSTLNEGFKQMVASEGCTTMECADLFKYYDEDLSLETFDFTKAKTKEKFVKTFKLENVYVGGVPDNSIYSYKIKMLSGEEDNFSNINSNAEFSLVGTTSNGEIISIEAYQVIVDINGLKSPNTVGRDIFTFIVFDFKDTVVVTPYNSKKSVWYFATISSESFPSEEERIRDVNDDCSVTSGTGGSCAEKIIMDGWKMNY